MLRPHVYDENRKSRRAKRRGSERERINTRARTHVEDRYINIQAVILAFADFVSHRASIRDRACATRAKPQLHRPVNYVCGADFIFSVPASVRHFGGG